MNINGDGSVSHFNKQKVYKKEDVFVLRGIDKIIAPKRRLYKGNIYALIDENTSSQAAEFASHLSDKTDAVFIGVETGGSAFANTGGDIVTLVLPNTRIRVEIPLFRNILDVQPGISGRGVIPDHIVRQTIKSKIRMWDVVLELVEGMIAGGKGEKHFAK